MSRKEHLLWWLDIKIKEALKAIDNQNGWGDEGEDRPNTDLSMLKELKGIVKADK